MAALYWTKGQCNLLRMLACSSASYAAKYEIDDAFIESGYANWKNAIDAKKGFNQHGKSAFIVLKSIVL